MKILLVLCTAAVSAVALDQNRVRRAPSSVEPQNAGLEVVRTWSGAICTSKLVNRGERPAQVREVVLFSIAHDLPPETGFYGEGSQMLSQTAGTLAKPVDLGRYTDRKHYRIPQPADATTAYGVITLSPPTGGHFLLAFTSSRRFVGRFHVRERRLDVVLDTENLTIAPGEAWNLEEFTFALGPSRPELLSGLADRIAKNHAPLRWNQPPTGWCSWYCFGPRVTAKNVLDNLGAIGTSLPALRYIQIDDGYQAAMGDWLDTGNAFGGDVRGVLRSIREKGFEPAIWVAPFIAEAGSKLFREHPEWFVKDADGTPLRSDKVTFGGWRRGPWYALDGTHPAARAYLAAVFRTMRNDWGVTYFKLDANFWGAIHGGRFHDPKATRVEAYRRGMEAILQGAGDAFILGCNHPIWPSFGLIHGSRSSEDIRRRWETFVATARQNLSRNWQNGRLWWNDPDAIVLTGDLPLNEYIFHATTILASGGMVLSGDDLTNTPADRIAILRKLVPPGAQAARFEDAGMEVGRAGSAFYFLNWGDTPRELTAPVKGVCEARDFWTGETLGTYRATLRIPEIPARSARAVVCATSLGPTPAPSPRR